MKTLCISWGLAAAIVLLWPYVPTLQERCLLTLQHPLQAPMFMEFRARPTSLSRSSASAASLKTITLAL
jgi:hypothetical protein